jgi:NAD(P)-dependent dehydrogenase (short-subunit alcohol dehydrogenase family)
VALAQAGADVALAGRSEPAETLALIEEAGRKAVNIAADLSSTEPVARVVDEAVTALGGSISWSTTPGSSAATTCCNSARRIGMR